MKEKMRSSLLCLENVASKGQILLLDFYFSIGVKSLVWNSLYLLP